MAKSDVNLDDLAQPGRLITVRVTPRAARDRITRDGDTLRIYVTVVPENGKANTAVTKLLAKALGIAPSQLQLLRGDHARDKVFTITDPASR